MIFRFVSGSSTPGQPRQEPLLGVDVDQRDPEALERLDHLLGLVQPHQAVIDEDAGQLLPHRAVDEQRRDRGVDAAGEAADHPALADLGADRGHLFGDHRLRRPLLLAAGDLAQEAGQDLGAVGGVDHLGVELDPVEAAVGRLAGGDRRGRGRGEGREPLRRLEDDVAVAHPAALGLGQAGEQPAAVIGQGQLGPPELPRLRPLDLAAEGLDHRLHPVTDPEHRDPELEQVGREGRRPRLVDRGRASGEHQPLGPALADRVGRGGRRQQLGEDPAVADPPRDQLRVLPSEVKNEDLLDIRFRPRAPLRVRRGRVGCFLLSRRAQSSETATPADTAALPLEPIPTACSVWSFLPSLCSAGATITSARWKERMSS